MSGMDRSEAIKEGKYRVAQCCSVAIREGGWGRARAGQENQQGAEEPCRGWARRAKLHEGVVVVGQDAS